VDLNSIDLFDQESYFGEGSRGFGGQPESDMINVYPITDLPGLIAAAGVGTVVTMIQARRGQPD